MIARHIYNLNQAFRKLRREFNDNNIIYKIESEKESKNDDTYISIYINNKWQLAILSSNDFRTVGNIYNNLKSFAEKEYENTILTNYLPSMN